jgi:adenine-specific DNA-methyltransferase
LIYPTHFSEGFTAWPKKGKKPNGLLIDGHTQHLVLPNEPYVLVKRFSAKEERRRVVAAVYDPSRISTLLGVGFENHLNYFHTKGSGLSLMIAKGLATFLNSTPVDLFFRQFSGHTQVNATDLRRFLRYPSLEQLEFIGTQIDTGMPDQQTIDALVLAALA